MKKSISEFTLCREWAEFLSDILESARFLNLAREYFKAKEGALIFPEHELIFHALNLTPPERIKLVLLGQDPYHSYEIVDNKITPHAMGLSFSTRSSKIPPSLKNIFKELCASRGMTYPKSGDLTPWAKRGALLLNASFSTEATKPLSHLLMWEWFSDEIIKRISERLSGVDFILLGAFARKKRALIDESRHRVFSAPHPSPMARGFLGSGVFDKIDFDFRI